MVQVYALQSVADIRFNRWRGARRLFWPQKLHFMAPFLLLVFSSLRPELLIRCSLRRMIHGHPLIKLRVNTRI